MQLKQLLYLKTVAETKSIRKASNKLFVSQQAISQSLKNLEEEYDCKLLERSVHGVTVTPTGLHVVSIAEKMLALEDELENFLRKKACQKQKKLLKIAAINSFKDLILPEAKIRFIKQYPAVQLTVHTMTTIKVLQTVLNKENDIGFLGVTYRDDKQLFQIDDTLQFIPLTRYKYVVQISEKSPLNNYHTLSVKSILKYPIIFLQEQLSEQLEDYLPYHVLASFGEVNALIADSILLMEKMVAENMGIAISSNGIWLKALPKGIIIKPLRDNIYGDFGYVVRKDNIESTIIKDFLNILQLTI